MPLSGKKTVTTAGTRVALSTPQTGTAPVAIKALAVIVGLIYLGDSTVASTNGFQLSAGDVIILDFLGDLSTLWIDSAVNGEGVTWLVLNT